MIMFYTSVLSIMPVSVQTLLQRTPAKFAAATEAFKCHSLGVIKILNIYQVKSQWNILTLGTKCVIYGVKTLSVSDCVMWHTHLTMLTIVESE